MQALSLSCANLVEDAGTESRLHQRVAREQARDDDGGDGDAEEPEKKVVLRVDSTDGDKNRDTDVNEPTECQAGLSPDRTLSGMARTRRHTLIAIMRSGQWVFSMW